MEGTSRVNGQMTAAVLYGKEDVKIEQVPIPKLDEGEVLVKVQVALTCGNRLEGLSAWLHARMIVPPALFGHEWRVSSKKSGPTSGDSRRGCAWWR